MQAQSSKNPVPKIPVLMERQLTAASAEAAACKSNPEHEFVLVSVKDVGGKSKTWLVGTACAGLDGKPQIMAGSFADGVLAFNRKKMNQCYIAFQRSNGNAVWARLAMCAVPVQFVAEPDIAVLWGWSRG